MNKELFKREEIKQLCSMYMNGELSINEEQALYEILSDSQDLPDVGVNTLKLMNIEKKIFDKKLKKKKYKWYYASVAAVFIVIIAIGIPFLLKENTASSEEEMYVVWQEGVKITGEEAKKLAEESQQEYMEMLRQVMRQQREMMKRYYATIDTDDYDL